jgi:hypothetical protein
LSATFICCRPGSVGHALARVGFDDTEAGLVRCHNNAWIIDDMHSPLDSALRYRAATRDNVVWVFSGLAEGDERWEQLRDGIMDRLAALSRWNRQVLG